MNARNGASAENDDLGQAGEESAKIDEQPGVNKDRKVKISRNLFQLKELLDLVIYKGAKPSQQEDSSADHVTVSKYKIDQTSIKTMAMDLPQEAASFEVDTSFQHQPQASLEKLNKIFFFSEKVNEEIQSLLQDDRNLDASLRLKLPEFQNMMENFSRIVISQGFFAA